MQPLGFVFSILTVCPAILLGQNGPASSSWAEQRVKSAQKRVAMEAQSAQAYNDLAFAFCRRARETGDAGFYDQAERALDRSVEISPHDYDAQKIRVAIFLGKHKFDEALKLAAELNRQGHDDIAVWGLLVDANVALGNYAEAERDAQWILDLRRGSALGFEKAAGLRELFGDFEGAIEFLDEAYRRTSQNDADQRSWLLAQNARLQLALGNLMRAEELVGQSLKLSPDLDAALTVRAKLCMLRGDNAGAISLFEKRYAAVSSPANLYDLAEALEQSGRREDAEAHFQEFERRARAETKKPVNANEQLIYYYADRKNNAAEALALAEQEIKVRHDSATLAAYAWALFRNGKYSEAKTEMDRALGVGIRDPVYFCHAARIAEMANDTTAADRFRKELANVSGYTCPVDSRTQTARVEPQ